MANLTTNQDLPLGTDQGFPAQATDDTAKPPSHEMDISDDAEDLAAMVTERWPHCRDGKRQSLVEQEHWDSLLAYRGEYDDDTLNRIRQRDNASEVFVKLPRSVVGGASALIAQLMDTPDGFPWKIKPTPAPDLDNMNIPMLQSAVQSQADQIQDPQKKADFLSDHDYESMVASVRKVANEKCAGMTLAIGDQLAETKWDQRFWKGIVPLTMYGTLVVKGPVTKVRRPKKWNCGADGTWKLALARESQKTSELKASFDKICEYQILDNWQVYPDPTADSRENMDDCFVRWVHTRRQLTDLKKEDGFKDDAIDRVLEAHPTKGNWVPLWWETKLHGTGATTRHYDHFEVLEYHRFMSGALLKRWGYDVPDELVNESVLAEIWYCAGEILKCVVSNLEPAEIPFHFVPYEIVPGRLWGRGIPKQMDDSTDIFNACERAIMDNMRACAGPEWIVDLSRLADRTDSRSHFPGKNWYVNDMEGLSTAPVIPLNTPANFGLMQAIQKDTLLHIQRETNLPDFALGIPGGTTHNRTAEGLSMQQTQAMAFIRSVIGNIDTFLTKPMIEGHYHWNMNFNPNLDIKGDMDIEASGVMGAISREMMIQKLGAIINQFGSDLKYHINGDKAIDLWAKLSGFVDEGLSRSMDEILAIKKQEADQEANAQAQSNRMQPITPPQNASLDILQRAGDVNSPIFGPALELVMKQYPDFNTDKMRQAIQNIETVANRATAGLVGQGDKIAATDPHAPPHAAMPPMPSGAQAPDQMAPPDAAQAPPAPDPGINM